MRQFCIYFVSSKFTLFMMRSSSHLVASSGFFVCSIIVTVLLLYFFFNYVPFISFSFLIVVARTSKNMFNRGGNSEHSCLIHGVKGNDFRFSLLSMMLAVCLTYTVLTMLR